jgi:hypothetical protein
MNHGGQTFEGTHEPLISKALFDRVQDVIRGKRKTRPERLLKPYIYRRVFRCGECNGFMTIETQKGHNYLRCTKKRGACSQRYVREEEVARQTDRVLRALSIPPILLGEMLKQLDGKSRRRTAGRKAERSLTLRKLADVDQKIDKLTSAYLDDKIAFDQYCRAKETVLNTKAALKEQSKLLEEDTSYWLEPTTRFVNRLVKASSVISGHDLQAKVHLLQEVGSNLNIQQKKIELEFRGAWKTIVKHGRLAQPLTAAPDAGAAAVGETDHIFTDAEEKGFEPL